MWWKRCHDKLWTKRLARVPFIAMWIFIDDWFLSFKFHFTLASHCLFTVRRLHISIIALHPLFPYCILIQMVFFLRVKRRSNQFYFHFFPSLLFFSVSFYFSCFFFSFFLFKCLKSRIIIISLDHIIHSRGVDLFDSQWENRKYMEFDIFDNGLRNGHLRLCFRRHRRSSASSWLKNMSIILHEIK